MLDHDGCPFCSWTFGDTKFHSIENLNAKISKSIFSLKRSQIRFCILHCEKRVVEHTFMSLIRDFCATNLETNDRAKRRAEFENICKEIGIDVSNLWKGGKNETQELKLTQDEARKMMSNRIRLIEALEKFIQKDTVTIDQLLTLLRSKKPTQDEIEQMKNLGKLLLEIFPKRFAEAGITPYIHILACHSGELQEIGMKDGVYLKDFDGNQIEAANWQDQRFFWAKTNRGGGRKKKIDKIDNHGNNNEEGQMFECNDVHLSTDEEKILKQDVKGKEDKKLHNLDVTIYNEKLQKYLKTQPTDNQLKGLRKKDLQEHLMHLGVPYSGLNKPDLVQRMSFVLKTERKKMERLRDCSVVETKNGVVGLKTESKRSTS